MMPDRDDVITEIVERIEATLAVDSEYVTIPLDLLQYALALLKEQDKVVRCKDCKWRGTEACFCKAKDDVQDNWFCSEAEQEDRGR